MLAIHRREKIMDLLREDGAAKVLDLAKLFKVTEVTIRKTLKKWKRRIDSSEHGGHI
jgi:DeoR/GlpR family transcriptional regulator of sugar metabolism